ncbi:NTP transferase domain-containing protein, partial [Ellagibacter isourolithinifaciens]
MTHPARGSQTKHGCIIMASGTSTRFGANKLIAELGGMPLIQHVLRATDGL